MKFHDSDLNDAVIASGGVITDSLNHIVAGTGENERVGRKCTLKKVFWTGHVTLPEVVAAATPGPYDRVRLILYLDKQANGATVANTTDILENAVFDSYRNLVNSGRFVILCDKKITLNYPTLASAGAGSYSHTAISRPFSLFKNINVPIEFSGTTGGMSEIKSNNLGVLVFSENGIAGLVSTVRLRFSDN